MKMRENRFKSPKTSIAADGAPKIERTPFINGLRGIICGGRSRLGR